MIRSGASISLPLIMKVAQLKSIKYWYFESVEDRFSAIEKLQISESQLSEDVAANT